MDNNKVERLEKGEGGGEGWSGGEEWEEKAEHCT